MKVRKKTGQTDGQTRDRYITLTARRGHQRNNGADMTCGSHYIVFSIGLIFTRVTALYRSSGRNGHWAETRISRANIAVEMQVVSVKNRCTDFGFKNNTKSHKFMLREQIILKTTSYIVTCILLYSN